VNYLRFAADYITLDKSRFLLVLTVYTIKAGILTIEKGKPLGHFSLN
jgi:hypothetical protein